MTRPTNKLPGHPPRTLNFRPPHGHFKVRIKDNNDALELFFFFFFTPEPSHKPVGSVPMASESQHRLLRPTESNPFSDLAPLSPQQSWDPLGSSRQTEDTAYHPVHDDSSVLEPQPRETGLGISHAETMPRVRKRTSQESSNAATSPGLLTPSPWGLPSPGPSPSASASAKDSAFRPVKCPSRAPILHRRLSWVSVTILLLALYATAFSGIYLVIGLLKPRWESRIGDGGLAPSTANLLSALFAKTIELSYVCLCGLSGPGAQSARVNAGLARN